MAPLGFEPGTSSLIDVGKEGGLRNVTQRHLHFPKQACNVTEGWRKRPPQAGAAAPAHPAAANRPAHHSTPTGHTHTETHAILKLEIKTKDKKKKKRGKEKNKSLTEIQFHLQKDNFNF